VLSWEEALAFGLLAERRDRLREQGNDSVADQLPSVATQASPAAGTAATDSGSASTDSADPDPN